MNKRAVLPVLAVLALGACRSDPVFQPIPEIPNTVAHAPAPAAPIVSGSTDHRIPGATTPLPAGAAERDIVTVRMHVDGMSCPIVCAREVKAMLAPVKGIVSIAVDTPTQTVQCEVLKGTDPQTLVAAIKSPYRARIQ
jgi:copper chaperone CopZ